MPNIEIQKILNSNNQYVYFRDNDVRYAATSALGLIKIATQEQVNLGVSDQFAITPSTLLNWSGNAVQAYGVIYNPKQSSPSCQKIQLIGNIINKVSEFDCDLFAHRFKRCIMDDLSTRHINYYLNQFDSTKKVDGTSACLTGEDGDVMVEIPVTYWRVTQYKTGEIEYLVSDHYFIGSQIHPYFYVSPGGNTPRTQYVGAYTNRLCDTFGAALITDQNAQAWPSFQTGYKARSIINTKPWTASTFNDHRIGARNNGGYLCNSLFYQYLLLMMVIQYGTFNTQQSISFGFCGLSRGLYTYYRFSGRCNFGNGTGQIFYDADRDSLLEWLIQSEDKKIIQFQYRGIQDPFGNITQVQEGIKKVNNGYYHTCNCDYYSDNYQQTYIFQQHNWPTIGGYAKSWNNKTFFALTTGANSNTYLTDYFWQATDGEFSFLRGGHTPVANQSGMGCININAVNTSFSSAVGSRIAC